MWLPSAPVEIDVWADTVNTVTAVATVAATVGAGVAAVAAWKVLGIERSRDLDAEQQRKRAQAERISAWMDGRAFEPTDQAAEYPDHSTVGLRLLNISDQPVYRVEVSVMIGAVECLVGKRHTLPPGADGERIGVTWENWAVIEADLRERGKPLGGSWETQESSIANIPVSVEFTDAAGQRWKRDFSGDLSLTAAGPTAE